MTWQDVDDVARALEAAAGEAPTSPRNTVIRARVLGELDRPRASAFAPAMLAVAAVVMLAVAAGVGAPVVGSFLHGASVETAPAATMHASSDEPSKALGGIGEKNEAVASESESVAPSVEAVPSKAPPVLVPSAPAPPSPSVPPTPSPQPGHLPIVLPTPPIPIPVPTLPPS